MLYLLLKGKKSEFKQNNTILEYSLCRLRVMSCCMVPICRLRVMSCHGCEDREAETWTKQFLR
jgi:hypothetical protein